VSKGELGKIHVYTGEGKGKTTAAFGLAIRASGNGFKVLIIQFLKKGEKIGEVVSCKRLPGITVEQYGTGRFVHEESITEEDRGLATCAMERAVKAASSRETDLLILDELNIAVHFGLVSVERDVRHQAPIFPRGNGQKRHRVLNLRFPSFWRRTRSRGSGFLRL